MNRKPSTGLITAVVSGLLFSACTAETQQAPNNAPDLIVINGDVYTVDPDAPRIDAFAVEAGRFSALGTSAEILALAGEDTVIKDANGNTVTPGLIDAHSHVSGDAPFVAGVDISYIADKAEWLRIIAEADTRMPEGEWMTGGYWDHTLSDSVYPTRAMLDETVPDRPVILTHIDGHYSWANSLALEMAGITADTPVPSGGEIVIDPATGEPSGILLEGAQSIVRDIIPARSDAQRQDGLAKMYQYANSFGLTGLHQMGSLDDYLHLVENGDPTLRIWYGDWWIGGPDGSLADSVWSVLDSQNEIAERVAATNKTDTAGPLLRLGYVKLINDGVLSAHTAVLTDQYTDREGWTGEYIIPPDTLKEQVEALTAAGLPVAIHSIGDAAVGASLDAFEAAKDNPVPFPNRIEHIEMVHDADVQRFRELGIVASMQPNHATNSIAYVPLRVGVERERRAYVWKSMLNADVTLVFGADYTTSPLSPLVQMADSIFRISPFGFNDGEPWHPEQAVSFEEALMAYTQAGANITPWKDEIGSISVGKWADFVVLDGKVPAPIDPSFRDLSVEATYFAGRQVYAKTE